MFAEFKKLPVAADKVAAVAQAPVTVEAKVDGVPKPAELVTSDQANMHAMGIAGIVESGDNIKLLNFQLGPITSALVGIPLGVGASKALGNWIPPYRDAAGVPTKIRPATIGFGQINILNPVAHVGGMVLVETWGANFLGRTAAHFIAGSLLINTLLTYTPLGVWLDNLVTAISPKPAAVAQNYGINTRQAQALRQIHRQEQGQSHNGRMTLSPF